MTPLVTANREEHLLIHAKKAWLAVMEWLKNHPQLYIPERKFLFQFVYLDGHGTEVFHQRFVDSSLVAAVKSASFKERVEGCATRAREKGLRVHNTPGALTAWTGRDISQDKWEGALLLPTPWRIDHGQDIRETFSGSGLPEQIDLLLCLLIAIEQSQGPFAALCMTPDRVMQYIEAAGPEFRDVYTEFFRETLPESRYARIMACTHQNPPKNRDPQHPT